MTAMDGRSPDHTLRRGCQPGGFDSHALVVKMGGAACHSDLEEPIRSLSLQRIRIALPNTRASFGCVHRHAHQFCRRQHGSPFMTLYAAAPEIPMTTVGLLLSLYSAGGLVTALFGGPVADRLGRKGVMVFSLLANSAAYLALSMANNLALFALLLAANGACNPLYRVGADAMIADLIPQERRSGAYALVRMSNNLGVAVGPAVGGFLSVSIRGLLRCRCGLCRQVVGADLRGRNVANEGRRLNGRTPRATAGCCAIAPSWRFKYHRAGNHPSSLMLILLPVYAKEQFEFGEPVRLCGHGQRVDGSLVPAWAHQASARYGRYWWRRQVRFTPWVWAVGLGRILSFC
jgi:MFS family permease